MPAYMIDIDLSGSYSDEFFHLVPNQRAYINRMMKEGIIASYSLSVDRKKLWVVINAYTPADAKEIVESFPIRRYIRYQIYDLMFHDSNIAIVPYLWLN